MSCSSRSENSGTGRLSNNGLLLGPVASTGTWHAAQPMASNTRRPAATSGVIGARGGGASSRMNDSKLSMPRRPVDGSAKSSGSGVASHNSSCLEVRRKVSSAGNRSFVMPISFR